MKNTVLILGAGASADYGYPLWGKLRTEMLDLDIETFLSNEVGLDETEITSHKLAHEEFCVFANDNPSLTLDQIIHRVDQLKEKHLNPTGHLLINIAGLLLAKVELERNDAGWVTIFQEVLIDYLVKTADPNNPSLNLLSNLCVVSLNYDRVFEHFISHDFYKKMVEHSSYNLPCAGKAAIFSRENQLRVFKPHGYICHLGNQNSVSHVGMNRDLVLTNTQARGTRYPGNDMSVAYGDSRISERDTFLRMGRHMYVVDERGSDDYRTPNDALRNAEVIVCLGLSYAGISQSSLDFSSAKTVFVSNEEEDIPNIQKAKPGPNYVSLGKDGARLDASDFPGLFNKICFEQTT